MSRVALIGENSVGYIDKLIDIWNNGDCAVLLDWRIPFQTAINMMKEAGVVKCYIEKSLFDKLEKETDDNILFLSFSKINTLAELLPSYIYGKFNENYSKNEAVVIYSSGTTGKSKGVILSHYAINTNAEAIIEYMKPTPNDCISIIKTLSHSSTIIGELLVALKSKMSLVIAPVIVPPRYIFKNIEKFGVTILCVNPTQLSQLSDEISCVKYNLKTLRTIYVSGSILSNSVYKKAHSTFENIPIYNVYGLSEAGPRVAAQRVECCKSNSVGKAIKNVEIKIVNERGCIVPNRDYGIIHIKTPSLFDGYVVGYNKHNSLYESWYNTGDVGYIDDFGELHIINRVDDVIIIDSHKVYPSEVEKIIVEQGDVKECAVAKVIFNGYEFIGCMYANKREIPQDIKKKLRTKLQMHEIPRFFIKCETLPKTQNGKISMRDVQAFLNKQISMGPKI